MFKKILSILLTLSMIIPCLTACANGNGATEQTKDATQTPPHDGTTLGSGELELAVTEELDISEDYIQALNEAVIMLLDSGKSYIKGVLSVIDGAAPMMVDETLYIPAEYVASNLGVQTQWDDESKTLSIVCDSGKLELTANMNSFTMNGQSRSMDQCMIMVESSLMVPAVPFCDALGQSVCSKEDLIIIGEDISVAEQGVSTELSDLVCSALGVSLDPGHLQEELTGASYEERSEYSKGVVIDPTMVPWSSPKDELAMVSGSLYIEDVSFVATGEGSYLCTMEVYNYLGYTYGSVESYDANDQLHEIERIKPFSGQKSSIVGAFCDVGVLVSDIQKAVNHWDLDYMNYKSELNSSVRSVEIEVPEGGYIFITCNPYHSDYVLLYDVVHSLVEIWLATGDVASLFNSKGDLSEFKGMMEDYIIGQLLLDSTAVHEISAEFKMFMEDVLTYRCTDIRDYVENIGQSFLERVEKADVDFLGLLEKAVLEVTTEGVDVGAKLLLGACGPLIGETLKLWTVMMDCTNLYCLAMDLGSTTKTQSIILECYDWKSAYAQVLHDYDTSQAQGKLTFRFGYINGDTVPELIVIDAVAHYGNTMELYSFQFRKMEQICDSSGNTQINIQNAMFSYVEQKGMVVRGDMRWGISTLDYEQIQNNAFTSAYHFNDNEGAEGSENASYTYNGETVPKFYYTWKLEGLRDKYDDLIINVSGFDGGYEITEEEIQRVLG